MIFQIILVVLMGFMSFFIVMQLLKKEKRTTDAHLHFSFPENNQVLDKLPMKIHARFGFPITNESYVRITKDNQPISNGDTFFDKDSLGLYYLFHKDLGKGKYVFNYEVFFWGDGSEKGSFCFFVK